VGRERKAPSSGTRCRPKEKKKAQKPRHHGRGNCERADDDEKELYVYPLIRGNGDHDEGKSEDVAAVGTRKKGRGDDIGFDVVGEEKIASRGRELLIVLKGFGRGKAFSRRRGILHSGKGDRVKYCLSGWPGEKK